MSCGSLAALELPDATIRSAGAACLDQLEEELARVVGPMTAPVADEGFESLGESIESFPSSIVTRGRRGQHEDHWRGKEAPIRPNNPNGSERAEERW